MLHRTPIDVSYIRHYKLLDDICLLDITGASPSRTFTASRNFSKIDHQVFATDLALQLKSIHNKMKDSATVDDLVDGYYNACKFVLDAHAPEKIKHRSVRFKPKWYNEIVVEARRERRRHERRWRKSGSDSDYQKYIDARRASADIISAEKSKFYSNKVIDCNAKDMHRSVNELLNVTTNVLPDCDSPENLANNFCTYFVGKVNKIRNELDSRASNSSTTHNYFKFDPQCNFSNFHLVTEEDLHDIIMKCPSKSCSLDPIPTWLVKKHLHTLLPLLTQIVNNSLALGYFPVKLRQAIIFPVIKKISLDKNQLSNYRPVSNLPFIGKLIEKLVSSQVSEYIDRNSLGDPYQSAYLHGRSTETALACVQNDILRAIDDKNAVFLLMLDLSAAFDTVDHGILLDHFACDFGITHNVLNWYKSYLSGRTCRVNINGAFSADNDLLYGVPQGSVVGPQAFSYYTRSVGKIIELHDLKYHIYADDVQIYEFFDPNCDGDATCTLFRLSQCVNDLQSWMLTNRLKLNQSKTEFFVASSPHHYQLLKHLTLPLSDQEIISSPTVRNLGVIFDHSMTMANHITVLSRSVNWQLRNLYRIRKFLDIKTLQNIVRTLILSKLDYCNSLLYGIDKKQLNRLQVLQNRCARLIFRQPRRSHATPLLRSLHWLPIPERIQFKVLCLCFKAFHQMSPHYLSSYFQLYRTTYALRSDSTITFSVPRSKKQLGDRALSVAGPRLWNELPPSIRGCSELPGFKGCLKSHLFPT